MGLLRNNFWAIFLLVAIIGGYVANNAESGKRDRAQAAQLVAGCKRTSYRTAILAYGQQDLATARRLRGEYDLAEQSDAQHSALLSTIPAPRGYEGSAALASVSVSKDAHGNYRLTVDPETLRLQDAGCRAAYS